MKRSSARLKDKRRNYMALHTGSLEDEYLQDEMRTEESGDPSDTASEAAEKVKEPADSAENNAVSAEAAVEPASQDTVAALENEVAKLREELRVRKLQALREERQKLQTELDVLARQRSRSSPPAAATKRKPKPRGERSVSPANIDALRADKEFKEAVDRHVEQFTRGSVFERRGASTSRKESPHAERKRKDPHHRPRGERRRSRNRRRVRDDSSSDSSSETRSSSYSSSSSSRSRDRAKGKKSSSKSSNKSGLAKSATDKVKFPQLWPHLALNYEFGFSKRNLTFFELDMRSFIAGELEIIQDSNLKKREKKGRIELMQELLYLAGSYEWNIILKIYAAVVGRIERGLASWASDFSQVIQMVATQEVHRRPTPFLKPKPKPSQEYSRPPSNTTMPQTDWAYFCPKFQKNACNEIEDHTGNFKGKTVKFQHICAKCWQRDKAKRPHPESAAECPHLRA